MTEIEKCVCGLTPDFLDPHIECPACGRTGIDVVQWNHDQRGLRLLREVYPFMHGNNYMPCGEDGRCWLIPERIWEEIREWNLKAEEGDRE